MGNIDSFISNSETFDDFKNDKVTVTMTKVFSDP